VYFGFDPRLGRPIATFSLEQRQWFGWAALLLAALAVRLLAETRGKSRVLAVVTAAAVLGVLWYGPLYHPMRIMEWWPQLVARPSLYPVVQQARSVGLAIAFVAGLATWGVAQPPRMRAVSNSHGSAEWGDGDEFRATDAEAMSLLNGDGLGGALLLGRHADGSLLLLQESKGHLLTMASSQSGKTVGTVITNALGYTGSMFFTDPKGETFFVTAEHRRDNFGQTVYAFDPFEVTHLAGKDRHTMGAYFNPLRLVPTVGPEAKLALDRARAHIETLILESKGENAFWDRMARQVGTGFTLYICYQFDCGRSSEDAFPVATPYGRDLLTLRYLTCLGADEFHSVLTHMSAVHHPLVRRVANMLLGADEKTRQNIMTSVHAQLGFLDSPQMAAVLAEFVPDDLGRNPRPNPLPHAELHKIKSQGVRQTVYLVIPPAFLETHAAWLRLMIVAVDDIITRSISPPDLPLLVVLEEFVNLGRLDAVRRGVSLNAGFGVRYWMIVQDLQQVENVYDKAWGTMFANAFVKQLFGTNDLRTAKELSELTGETTVYSDSGNSGKSLDSAGWIGKGRSVGESMSEKGRRLLLADELLSMDPNKQLLQIRGHRPMFVDKLNYLQMPEVQGLYKPNPMK